MSALGRPRQGPCPCGSGEPVASCCLPREAAFQLLLARLLAFAETPEIRQEAADAADLFWGPDEPTAARQQAESRLRFLEWLLQDHVPDGALGSRLGEFADRAGELPSQEAELLLGMLLAPVRAYQVTEPPSPRGLTVKDLLTGEERLLTPFGIGRLPIRSDLLVCRTLPFGRGVRAGVGIMRLPGGCREELSAYLRMASRLGRAPRHVSLEDFLDGAPLLYHHYYLARGAGSGAEAWATVRGYRFAPGCLAYCAEDGVRLRAALSRQPDMEREALQATEEGYRWIDPRWGTPRARFVLQGSDLTVRAETAEDLAAAEAFTGDILHGLARPVAVEAAAATPPPGRQEGPGGERWGRRFLRRAMAAWPDAGLPLLGGLNPRQAVGLPSLRRSVASLLGDLERSLARQKRLGRAWVDVSGLWELLGIEDLAPAQPGVRHGGAEAPRVDRRAGVRRTGPGPRRARRDHHR